MRLALLFTVIFLVLACAAFFANRVLVQSSMFDESFRYQTETARRQAVEIQQMLLGARALAVTFAGISRERDALQPVLGSIAQQPEADWILAAGIWPLPVRDDVNQARQSAYWIRRNGAFERLDDYNDTRSVPYWHEKWFTPARYAKPGHCYWTPAYRDPLLQREIVTCATPIQRDGQFAGVATVSLDRARIAAGLGSRTQNDSGYGILLDRDNQLLGATEALLASSGNVLPASAADVAKRLPKLAPLALTLHQWNERFLRAVVTSSDYEPSLISALRDGTREMARDEAESALISLWAEPPQSAQVPELMHLKDDPVLHQPATAVFLELPETHWRLVRVVGSREGFAGARYVVNQSLAVSLAAVALCLLLVFAGLRRFLLDRLSRMASLLDDSVHSGAPGDVLIDDSGRDEIGMLAHWSNERLSQLHDLYEQLSISRNALQAETEARRSAQKHRQESEARLAQVLGAVEDALVVTDGYGRIEDMNLHAQELISIDPHVALGQAFDEVFKFTASEQGEPLGNPAKRAIDSNSDIVCNEPVFLDVHGTAKPFRINTTALCSRDGVVNGAAVAFRSADTANTGPATHPEPNGDDASRGACDRVLRRLQEQSRLLQRSHSFLYVDIDNLNAINGNAGIDAGSEALAHVWHVLTGQLEHPEMAFRLGADQFAVVLENRDVDAAATVAETLRDAVSHAPLRWERRDIRLSVSVGVTPFDGKGSPFQIIKRGEDACHAAKAAGRNCVRIFESSMERGDNSGDDVQWLKRIRHGLDRDMFHLTTQWIQPYSGAAAGRDAFEFLVALEDEEGFWTAASQFLPVAERNNLGREIDQWVIKHAFAMLAQRLPQMPNVEFCSINLSPASLDAPETLDQIIQLLQTYPELSPERLMFEIREEAVAEHPIAAARFCETLRGLGCRIALDQFVGRRGNDLALIRTLPLDYVKLSARQFRKISEDQVERMVAESVLRLARTLDLHTIITGIEDAASLPTWSTLGADYCQGNVIAKATPVVFASPGV
ncbi:MAG: EAL domain-containing protein [Gammaproteobacteria bacterium]|nr:EAL domain-containing protein [Gammaproteobacteria bacterium]